MDRRRLIKQNLLCSYLSLFSVQRLHIITQQSLILRRLPRKCRPQLPHWGMNKIPPFFVPGSVGTIVYLFFFWTSARSCTICRTLQHLSFLSRFNLFFLSSGWTRRERAGWASRITGRQGKTWDSLCNIKDKISPNTDTKQRLKHCPRLTSAQEAAAQHLHGDGRVWFRVGFHRCVFRLHLFLPHYVTSGKRWSPDNCRNKRKYWVWFPVEQRHKSVQRLSKIIRGLCFDLPRKQSRSDQDTFTHPGWWKKIW